ncbi:SDR family NAD(P)-dependent oxidoreductase [Paenibacillus cymbidii]|uniref:SDR family NAD(P)-dependent oxidoreductase n=1 Tax=Paenibacillus cymbidii TaxID=1639034 RepID=UPI0010810FB5|nr:SDR family NAD(P)-dependent oxidoreductase [Paenibacillus cymbidii]
MTTIAGQKALITGATRGIGKAIASAFVAEGAAVAICGVEERELNEAVRELSAGGGTVHGFVADVSDPASAAAFVEQANRTLGGVDALVNNAGIAPFYDFLTMPLDVWDRTLAVNLRGSFIVGQAAARLMAEQGGGVIVNMSSTNGLFGEERLAAYNASKAGVILLTKTMALELAKHNIRVNAVCPGFIGTDLALSGGSGDGYLAEAMAKIPLGRWGTPAEVADLFLFLASSRSSFITGQTFVIDGGQTTSQ